MSRRPPFPTISFEEPDAVIRDVAQMDSEDAPSAGSISISTAPLAGPLASSDDSQVVLDAVATANLTCHKWSQKRNLLIAKHGVP